MEKVEDRAQPHKLSIFTLTMINVAAMISLSNITSVAKYGLSSVSFYLLAALVFLIPVSFVAAELATGWPQHGGVYIWVKEGLGGHWGFLAISLQWIQIMFFYPTILSFAAAALSYSIDQNLSDNKIFIFLVIVVFFWLATFLNFKGIKLSSYISTVGVIFGTLIPGLILILLAGVFLIMGYDPQTSLAIGSIIPNLSKPDNVVFGIGILLMFAGLEMSATHAEDVDNPQKSYPKAILLTTIIVITIMSIATVSIAIVVPSADIGLVSGLMQAVKIFLDTSHLSWFLPIFAFFLVLGVFGTVSTWITGPTKGLLTVARHGYLPPFLQKTNDQGIPTTLLLIQASVVTLLAVLFLFIPSVNSSFWILTSMAIQFYLLMYILMFTSAIVLRYKQPDVHRDFRVPGGNRGMNIIAGLGIIAAVTGFIIGFIPPSDLHISNRVGYVLFDLGMILLTCAIPFFIYYLRNPKWETDGEKFE